MHLYMFTEDLSESGTTQMECTATQECAINNKLELQENLNEERVASVLCNALFLQLSYNSQRLTRLYFVRAALPRPLAL